MYHQWVTFLKKKKKSIDMGPVFVKTSLEEGPISRKKLKIVKSAIFEVEKPLRNGSWFTKILKEKKKNSQNQPFFDGEKSLDMGSHFRPCAAHPVKK